jgi:hypothetical protein
MNRKLVGMWKEAAAAQHKLSQNILEQTDKPGNI